MYLLESACKFIVGLHKWQDRLLLLTIGVSYHRDRAVALSFQFLATRVHKVKTENEVMMETIHSNQHTLVQKFSTKLTATLTGY